MTMISDLRDSINSILTIRDDLGAAKAVVYLITRTWSGTQPGDGSYYDVQTLVSPSPSIKTYMDDYVIKEGGSVQQGDLKLKWISKQSFATKDLVDGSSSNPAIEKFYMIDDAFYRVVGVEDRLLSWNVLVRRITGAPALFLD